MRFTISALASLTTDVTLKSTKSLLLDTLRCVCKTSNTDWFHSKVFTISAEDFDVVQLQGELVIVGIQICLVMQKF